MGNFINPRLLDELGRQHPGIYFDAVSCQFALHYSWTTETDAYHALRNAAVRLRKGGLFIGTTTDANVLVKKLRQTKGLHFGNRSCFVCPVSHLYSAFPPKAAVGGGVRRRRLTAAALTMCPLSCSSLYSLSPHGISPRYLPAASLRGISPRQLPVIPVSFSCPLFPPPDCPDSVFPSTPTCVRSFPTVSHSAFSHHVPTSAWRVRRPHPVPTSSPCPLH